MAKPEDKHPDIDDLLKAGGFDRIAAIRGDGCILCKGPAIEFDDALSKREYTISGMCQACQNKYFTEGEEEEDDGKA